MEFGFDVLAHLTEVLVRPGDVDARQVVVGGPDQDQPVRASVKGCPETAQPAPVGVDNPRKGRVFLVAACAGRSGDGRVQAVCAHDDAGPAESS